MVLIRTYTCICFFHLRCWILFAEQPPDTTMPMLMKTRALSYDVNEIQSDTSREQQLASNRSDKSPRCEAAMYGKWLSSDDKKLVWPYIGNGIHRMIFPTRTAWDVVTPPPLASHCLKHCQWLLELSCVRFARLSPGMATFFLVFLSILISSDQLQRWLKGNNYKDWRQTALRTWSESHYCSVSHVPCLSLWRSPSKIIAVHQLCM